MVLRLLVALGALILVCSPRTGYSQIVCSENPTLVLYYSPYCRYSQTVLRYLDQIHKTIPMKNITHNPEAKEELRKYGGKMQVPCLLINEKPLYESDAIIQWLSQHQNEY